MALAIDMAKIIQKNILKNLNIAVFSSKFKLDEFIGYFKTIPRENRDIIHLINLIINR
jgi:hypothetical protein